MSFEGDGKYPRDGGSALEQLYGAYEWRAIPRCDGRFVCRAANGQPPESLCPGIVRLRHRTPDADGIVAARLRGGGGLLSYEKERNWVHTLNTDSGLVRKLVALGLFDDFAKTIHDPRAVLVFRATERLLECIDDPERTRLAPAAAAALRVNLARVALRLARAQ